jgi:hypothetical protein
MLSGILEVLANENFSDGDFAEDRVTRRSTTGVIAIFVDGAVSWTSRLQKTIALSATEAEIIAACEGAKEFVCLKLLLSEMFSDFARKNTDTVHRQRQCHQTNQEPGVSQKVETN